MADGNHRSRDDTHDGGSGKGNSSDDYFIPVIRVGVRDAKANLSRLLREVKQGREVVITEYGKPIGRILPVRALSLAERIAEMESRGEVESGVKLPPKGIRPLPVPDGLAQKYLQEGRK